MLLFFFLFLKVPPNTRSGVADGFDGVEMVVDTGDGRWSVEQIFQLFGGGGGRGFVVKFHSVKRQ